MSLKKAFCIIFAFLLVSCASDKAEWGGSVTEENGVTMVKNPVEPLYSGDAFDLSEDLSIGEKEGAPEYMFQRLYSVAVNDFDEIYVLDYQAKQIKMYDREGEYIRTFGRPGQGPGELQAPRFMLWTSQSSLVVGDMNRISYFDREGGYVKSTTMLGMAIFQDMDRFGNSLVIDIAQDDSGVYEIKKFDPDYNYLCSFGTSPLPSIQGASRRNLFFPVIRAAFINGDQVIAGYAGDGYLLKVYDGSANLLRRIEKEYIPVAVTEEAVEDALEEYPPEMRGRFDVPKNYPPFRWLLADDEGRIWVYTYEKSPDGQQTYFDVFDTDGRFLSKIPLKSRPQLVKKGKIYAIEEDNEGYQYVKRYTLVWKTGEKKD